MIGWTIVRGVDVGVMSISEERYKVLEIRGRNSVRLYGCGLEESYPNEPQNACSRS